MKTTKLLLLALALSSTGLMAENKFFDLTKGSSQTNGSTVTLSLSQSDTLWVQCSNTDGKKDNYIEFQLIDPTVLSVSRSGSSNEIFPRDTTKVHSHYMSLVPQKIGTTIIKCFAGKVQPEVGPQPLVNEQSSITVNVVE
jgi:hypothetical protein